MKTLVLIPQERYQQLLSKEANASSNVNTSMDDTVNAKQKEEAEQRMDEPNQAEKVKETTVLSREPHPIKAPPPPPGEPDLPRQLGGSDREKQPKRMRKKKKSVWQSKWTSY